MAVTAHYFARITDDEGKSRDVWRTQLIAFRHLPDSHTGEHPADTFLAILEPLGLLDKVRSPFTETCSRCADIFIMVVLFEALSDVIQPIYVKSIERQLRQRFKIFDFDHEQNHIKYTSGSIFLLVCSLTGTCRCFPHVVNIAAQTAIKVMSKSAPDPGKMVLGDDFEVTSVTPLSLEFELNYDSAYDAALEGDIVARVRDVVHTCRASSLRREHFVRIIKQGNKEGTWKDAEGKPVTLDVLQLLRDVDTRWSSTYLMIEHLIRLNVVRLYFSRHSARSA